MMAKIENFLPKISNKARMSALTISISHCTGGFSYCNEAGRGSQKHPDWKEYVKLPLFADNCHLCRKSYEVYKIATRTDVKFYNTVATERDWAGSGPDDCWGKSALSLYSLQPRGAFSPSEPASYHNLEAPGGLLFFPDWCWHWILIPRLIIFPHGKTYLKQLFSNLTVTWGTWKTTDV